MPVLTHANPHASPALKPAALPQTSAPTALSIAQKLEALRRVQAQAEQRVQLGTQLLKAAEAHTTQTQSYVEQVRAEQNELRAKLEKEMAAALTEYDEWVIGVDETLTQRMQQIEHRLAGLDQRWEQTEQRLTRLVKRAEQMFEQSRTLLETAATRLNRYAAVKQTPPAMMNELKLGGNTESIDAEFSERGDDIPTVRYSNLIKKLYDNDNNADAVA